MFRRMALCVVLAVGFGLVAPSEAHASPPTSISVTLSGPTEGWPEQGLTYTANGIYTLDGETQEEIQEGEASVTEKYQWSYAPATCDTPPATDRVETFRFAWDYAGAVYTISVTYTVTITYKDNTSHTASASDSIDVEIFACEVSFLQSHDYIVPGSSLNTIKYELMISSGVQGDATIFVEDNACSVVRELSVPANEGVHTVQWDGYDSAGQPLSGTGSPYAYRIEVHADGGLRSADLLQNRGVIEWITGIIIKDRSSPDSTFESGIDEDTIADAGGNPNSFHVSVEVSGGGGSVKIPYYDVLPDTGEQGWDARVDLLNEHGDDWHIFYTTPTPDPDLPDIRYTMQLWQTDPYVQDRAGNKWDMDPETDTQATSGTWQFGIGPSGHVVGWEESYE